MKIFIFNWRKRRDIFEHKLQEPPYISRHACHDGHFHLRVWPYEPLSGTLELEPPLVLYICS